jgi:hypothetical protein
MRRVIKLYATLMNWVAIMVVALWVLFFAALFTLELWERFGIEGIVTTILLILGAVAWFGGMVFKLDDRDL